jgi:P4 family phage/plasmid primase-like protien
MIPTAIRYGESNTTPCPVCGSLTKGCSRLEDGLQLCRGNPVDAPLWQVTKPADANGFICYRPATAKRPKAPREKSSIDWRARAEEFASKMRPAYRETLAAKLLLPVDALNPAVWPLIGIAGAESGEMIWSFAESDALGRIVGVKRRFPTGEKKLEFMASHGLTIPANFDASDSSRPLLIVEGASDTIAGTYAGLSVVGRPSNTGGAEYLAELLKSVPATRQVIIVGENDQKPNGDWPGREGAISVATRLAAVCVRVIHWSLPPTSAKDVRAWLVASTIPGDTSHTFPVAGQILAAHFLSAAEPISPPAPGSAEAKSLPVALPGEDPNPAKWDFEPENPQRLARAFLATLTPPDYPADAPPYIRYWRSEYHEYKNGVYQTRDSDDFRASVGDWIEEELQRVFRLALFQWESASADSRGPRPTVIKGNRTLTSNTLASIENKCRVHFSISAPAWIDGVTGKPDPSNIVAVSNGLLDLTTGILHPLTPSYFNFSATPFQYLPNSPPPAQWIAFLSALWEHSETRDNIKCLQEWFGYLLTPDTRQQKLLFILGPKRAGKGTIARILRGLVGDRSYTGPTLSSLAGEYGLWPLIGKSVAVISDARLSGRVDTQMVVERILSVTGEDTTTINRKNLSQLDAKLSARFVIMSNELPNLTDASGALASRMILLKLTRSYFGDEDTGLTDRLLTELPGILNWAIEGWHRLRARGRFVQPASGAESIEEMNEIGSPVATFIRERCIVAEGFRVPCKELYEKWKNWCDDNGRKEYSTSQIFSRNLKAAYPDVKTVKQRLNGDEIRHYSGLRLISPFESIHNDEKETQTPTTETQSETQLRRSQILPKSNGGITGDAETQSNSTPEIIKNNVLDTSECNNEKKILPFGEFTEPTASHCVSGSGSPEPRLEHSPDTALYFSRKLDFEYLPSSQTLPVIDLCGVNYYRLTPETFLWVEQGLERLSKDDAEQARKDYRALLDWVDSRFTEDEARRLSQLRKDNLPMTLPTPPEMI